MTSGEKNGEYEEFLSRLREGQSAVSASEKRRYLRSIGNELKHGLVSEIPQSIMPILHALAEDESWEARQDVAELLLYVPEDDFAKLAGTLANDPNGYVRRAAERAQERRRKAESQVKRASRGIEQMSEEHRSFSNRFGCEAADEAIRLGERRFALLANAAVHDLLNLLTPLKSQAQALAKGLSGGDAALSRTASRLNDGMDLIERSIRDLEAYAQALPPERHPEWLHEVVHLAKELALQNLQAQGFDLSPVMLEDGDVAEVRVEMSRQLIVQALTNIITNAYEAFADHDGRISAGRITISTRTEEGRVLLEVRDTGCGLPDEELASLRAFLPGRKNMNKKRSTGSGLILAKKYIDAHEGAITVESRLNKGTTVLISLPVRAGEEQNGQGADS